MTLFQLELTLTADLPSAPVHRRSNVALFSVLTGPAELLVSSALDIVMATRRHLKKENVDRQRTFLSSIADFYYNQITVNTPAQPQFSIDGLSYGTRYF